MRKWARRLCVLSLIALLAAAVFYECSTHVGRGWLRGEAFYDGRPTSYWREIVLQDLQFDPRRFVDPITVRPTSWSEFHATIGIEPRWDISLFLISNTSAVPVLWELIRDEDDHVSTFAQALWNIHQLDPEGKKLPPARSMDSDLLAWQKLICRHNIKHKGFENLLD